MHSDRSFVVAFPYFLAAGALHLEDVLELYVSGDPLGIRGRMGLFYARATFKRAREVEEAAAAIAPNRPGLWDFILVILLSVFVFFATIVQPGMPWK